MSRNSHPYDRIMAEEMTGPHTAVTMPQEVFV